MTPPGCFLYTVPVFRRSGLFSETKISLEAITAFLRSRKEDIGYHSLDIATSYNRNLVSLEFEGECAKPSLPIFRFRRLKHRQKNRE